MDGLLILAIVLWVYAAFVIFIALVKPAPIWNMAKIQGFVRLLGEKGTVVFFIVWAIAAAVGGYFAFINADI
ncbi:MAG: hypothetical protein Kow0056_13580 [Coriobacteriia bacterium]